MTTAVAVLESLAERGIHVELEDDHSLVLRPTALVNADVIGIVRDAKPAIVRHLQLRDVNAADREDPTAWLLNRLTAGIDWLNVTSGALHEQPNVGLGAITTSGTTTHIPSTRLNDQLVSGLDRWHRLEDVLREVLHYDGCVRGAGETCGVDSVVRCRACVGVSG